MLGVDDLFIIKSGLEITKQLLIFINKYNESHNDKELLLEIIKSIEEAKALEDKIRKLQDEVDDNWEDMMNSLK